MEITISQSLHTSYDNCYVSEFLDKVLPSSIFEIYPIKKLQIHEGLLIGNESGNLYRYPTNEPKEAVTMTFYTSYGLSISVCLTYSLDTDIDRPPYMDDVKYFFGNHDPGHSLTEIHFESSITRRDNQNSMYSFLSFLKLYRLSTLTIRQPDFDQLQLPDSKFDELPFLLNCLQVIFDNYLQYEVVHCYNLNTFIIYTNQYQRSSKGWETLVELMEKRHKAGSTLEQLIFVRWTDEDIQSIPVETRLLGSGTMVIPGVKSIRVVEPADAPVFKPFD
ncbi:hypothetical protein C8Q75DRAFT_812175 [Abortiporus biennis]|nr:hypothetical protein C8Q75DRAFT_812175 [Abortiporus biennis]